MSNKIKRTIKPALSVILIICLLFCGIPAYVFAEGENDRVQTFETTREDLEKAITRDFLSDERYSVRTDGGIEAFEIFPDMEEENVKNIEFNTYFIPFENTDDITGDEWVVFSIINNSGNAANAKINIDDISSGVFIVPSGTRIATASDASMYNATASNARRIYDAESESNATKSDDDDKYYMTDYGFLYIYTSDDGTGGAVFATTVALLGLTFDDMGKEAKVYSVIYVNDNDDAMLIAGPDTINEGEDLIFTVTVTEGYELVEALINDETVEPEEVSAEIVEYSLDDEESTVYEYIIRDVGEDLIVTLSSVQIINGTGSMTAYGVNAVDGSPSYTITVTDAPTNTKISVNSPRITVTDEDGNSIYNAVLKDNLYYLADSGERTDVAYFILTGERNDEDENTETVFALVPYDSEGNEITDDGSGQFILVVSSEILTTQIWKIQANYLCSLDKNGNYQQEIIEAVSAFNPTIYYTDNLIDGNEIAMTELTEDPDGEFYYGSTDTTKFSLTQFTTGVVKDGIVYPEDSNGNAVENVSIYMVYDRLYSFDVEITDVVNEHTEDNGDTYLWLGGNYYVDTYHNQGSTSSGYTTRSANGFVSDTPDGMTWDIGAWVQLAEGKVTALDSNGAVASFDGNGREAAIKQTGDFTPYTNVTLTDIQSSIRQYGTNQIEDKKGYSIVGPYYFSDNSSNPTTSIVRVTGRVGDKFTVQQAFGTDVLYAIQNTTTHYDSTKNEWLDLGAHAADDGTRAWWYWISDFYVPNNYEDRVEYAEITKSNENDNQERLEINELGTNETGESLDIWSLVGLYTKRPGIIKKYMLNNQTEFEEIGFNASALLPTHIQLRMDTIIQTVIGDTIYTGDFTILTTGTDADGNSLRPNISYTINLPAEASDTFPDGLYTTHSEYVDMDNDKETKSISMYDYSSGEQGNQIYIPLDYIYDADAVKITVSINCTGTLTGDDGTTIEYTAKEPLNYTLTLNSDQLKEAYDCCPNQAGYDVAIELNDAVQIAVENSITLYKIWDDESNIYHTRDNVTSVTVSLERSKDRENWEIVKNELGETKPFSIYGDNSSSIWNLTLSGSDIDLTYEDESGETKNYYFRIAEEQAINGLDEGIEYVYAYSVGDDDLSVIITNTLYRYVFDITGEKKWTDLDGNPLKDNDEAIPDSIIVALYQNDEFYDMKTVYKADDWKFTFESLPQVTSGNLYQYTLYELDTNGTRMGTGNIIFYNDNAFMISITEGTEEDGVDYVISNALCPSTSELPSSGGQGTKWFYLIGLGLVTIAGILLVIRKRLRIR